MNFANYVDMAAADHSEKLAMSDPKREMTYGQLSAETAAIANGLADLGVDPDDHVALFIPNSVTFMTAYLGAMKLGAVPVPINLRFGEEEIAHVLADIRPAALFTIGRFQDAFADHDLDLIVAGGDRGIDYGELVADAEKSFDIEPQLDSNIAEILYTSGTTGTPKGVQHTHGNLAANARGGRARMGYGAETVFLTAAPLFHASGLNATTTPALVHGAENHFIPEWDPETVLRTMEDRGVTYTMLIPTMVIDLIEHGTEGYDLSAFESLNVGGSPMPKERIEAAESALDCSLYEGYGMTETTLGTASNAPGQAVYKAGSIGTVAGEMADVRIENPDTRETVQTGEKGELLWRGDTIMAGYLNRPEKNEEVFVERAGLEWLRSGDIGHMDEDGHLYVDDRIDDMIISGGENVYPREIEDVLYELDGVIEAAVIGMPDDRLGERVTAILRTDGDVSVEDVQGVCRDRLADYKVPRQVEFVDELPKTSTRKIDKVALRDQFEDRAASEGISPA